VTANGINIPVRYGGQGFDYLSLGLVCDSPGGVWGQRPHKGEKMNKVSQPRS